MNADGTGLFDVTNRHISALTPDWSPDGTEILFSGKVGKLMQLYTITPSGTNLKRIATDGFNDTDPAWQPGP